MTEKYEKLKDIFMSSTELNTPLESKYQSNLENQIAKYTSFLQVAKTHIQPLNTRDEIVGVHLSNDKVPFNMERGDTVGVSLANATFATQIDQSEEYITRLERYNQELKKEIKSKKEINEKLEIYIEEVNKRIEEDQGPTNELDDLEHEVQDEKVRYRKLRKLLKQLIQEYE